MRYYVNTKTDDQGDHEVHNSTCKKLPLSSNRIDLGDHSSCRPAVIAAKRHYDTANGCFWCSRPCHTS